MKARKLIVANEGRKKISHPNPLTKLCRCIVCGGDFKSRSLFDTLCNVCWADNEMRPYSGMRSRSFGGVMVN
jgi:hypothetical protein